LTTLSTHQPRTLLPATVPHGDAVFNGARAALLVHALAEDPSRLLQATEDRLHQEQRAPGMPQSVELMRVLRHEGLPAVIAAAGPAAVVLDRDRSRISAPPRRIVTAPADGRIAEVPLRVHGATAAIG